MKASDLFVRCLENEDVERVYGVPGEENEDLLFSLRDSSVEFVPTRHEQGAAFMANVHGRLTGDAGVCLGTLGPGATNLVTGVADANLDRAPLVAVTGQGGLERLHKESHQALDIVDMFGPITKWNAQISDPDIVHESVRKAFKIAEYEKPGATHVELPEDVAAEEANGKPLGTRRVRRPNPDIPSVEEVAEKIHEADKPLIITGNGAVRTAASRELRELVETYDIPVASTYMGKGAVSDADPHSLMTLDSGDHEEASSAIHDSDLVITVGYDIAEHDPAGWNPASDTDVIHIDSEPAEVYEQYDPDIEVVSDIPAALEKLTQIAEERGCVGSETDWYADLREHIVEDVTEIDDEFTVRAALPVLRDVLADDDVLISDVGSHKMAIAQNYPTYEPNTCIISNGLASMGIAVPGAVSADIAVDANVVAATGDGGFLMNAAEIETATRLGCGFTVIVFNDNDYGLISEKQADHRNESFGTVLTNPDLEKFAESFGVEGHTVEDWSNLRGVLERSVGSNDVSLVEIPVE
jgi:acetolactate synthase-1/2/3 large subunit